MMVCKRIMLLGIICLCMGFLICGNGIAGAAETKIGVMNGQKVLWTCADGAKAKAKLEEKMKGFQEKFKAEEQALVALQNEIEKKSSAWSKEKKDEKGLEFNKKRRDLQTKQEDARGEMNQLKESELQPIIKLIQTELEKFGKEHGYTVILDSNSGAVPYFNQEAVEVTDAIIKDLDKSMAKK
jgi:outer membrane protein